MTFFKLTSLLKDKLVGNRFLDSEFNKGEDINGRGLVIHDACLSHINEDIMIELTFEDEDGNQYVEEFYDNDTLEIEEL